MSVLNIAATMREVIAQVKKEDDFPAFAQAFREMDVDKNGAITFAELVSPAYINRHCKAALRTRDGYMCADIIDAADGNTSRLSPSLEMRDRMRYDIADMLKEYGEYRKHLGPLPEKLLAIGELQFGSLNQEMKKSGLPQIDGHFIRDAVAYGEAHLDQFRSTGYIRTPAPMGIPTYDLDAYLNR